MYRFAAAIFLLVLFSSCRNNNKDAEPGNTKDVDPEAIFFDYQVTGKEGSDLITVLIQFRYGGEFGGTLKLEEPGNVQLDGEIIKGDSTKATGAFYELQKPVEEFTGSHTIVFTSNDKKKYREEFSFQPLQLLTEIPAIVPGDSLDLKFGGLEPGDIVRVVLTDTVFGSEGITRLDTIRDESRIVISREELESLTNGPIQIELIKESEAPVQNGTLEGGRLYISYGLKREFTLAKKEE